MQGAINHYIQAMDVQQELNLDTMGPWEALGSGPIM